MTDNTTLDAAHIQQFMTAVGDPQRLRLLFVMHENRLNVGQIAAQFQNLSRPAISHHLKVLKDAGVLTSEKIGQEVFYRINKSYLIHELRTIADQLENLLDDDKVQ